MSTILAELGLRVHMFLSNGKDYHVRLSKGLVEKTFTQFNGRYVYELEVGKDVLTIKPISPTLTQVLQELSDDSQAP